MAPSENYKFFYFNIPGLGEAIRFLLATEGSRKYEDIRVEAKDWGQVKPTMGNFKTMPVLLSPEGKPMSQARALCRLLAKTTVIDGKKLYPDDHMEAFYCDELMDAAMDIQKEMAKTFALEGEAQLTARQNLFKEGGLCFNITTQVQSLIASHGKEYCVTDYLTVGDLFLWSFLNTLRCGFLDGVDPKYMNAFPELEKRMQKVASQEKVAAYYATLQDDEKYKGHYKMFLPGA